MEKKTLRVCGEKRNLSIKFLSFDLFNEDQKSAVQKSVHHDINVFNDPERECLGINRESGPFAGIHWIEILDVCSPLIARTPGRSCSTTAGSSTSGTSTRLGTPFSGVSVPGAFKLDHLQPVKLILSHNLSTFLIFLLGSPIPYYPRQRAGNEKRESPKSE